jgi:hypothetical protein
MNDMLHHRRSSKQQQETVAPFIFHPLFQLSYTLSNGVTRLGEYFCVLGDIILWAVFLITKVDQICWLLFSTVKVVY